MDTSKSRTLSSVPAVESGIRRCADELRECKANIKELSEKQKAICREQYGSMSVTDMAKYCKVSRVTIYSWLK